MKAWKSSVNGVVAACARSTCSSPSTSRRIRSPSSPSGAIAAGSLPHPACPRADKGSHESVLIMTVGFTEGLGPRGLTTVWSAVHTWPRDIVRVFEVDPDLLDGVQPEAACRLRRQVAVDLLVVTTGMSLPLLGLMEEAYGLLVLDGMLLRRVTLAGRSSVELVGPGDVLRPWQDGGGLATLPAETSWRALQQSPVAGLDPGLLALLRPLPRGLPPPV